MKSKKVLAFFIAFIMVLQNFATIAYAVEEDLAEKKDVESSKVQDLQEGDSTKILNEEGTTKEKIEEEEEKIKINFEDANFADYILNKYDFDEDGVITDSDLVQIETLDIYTNFEVKSFKGIEAAKNVKTINISNYYSNADVSTFFEMSNVECLNIYGNINDLMGIEKMTKLKTLSLHQSTSNIDINYDPIKNLNLESLTIDNYMSNIIFDLNLVANMTNLQYLSINGKVTNQQILNNLQQITCLSLTNANIDDLEFLANLTNLQTLNLSRNKITNISVLSNCTQLNYLDLRQNPININSTENIGIYETIIQNGGQVEVNEYDESEIITIPDNELKKYLLESYSIDANNDGEISKYELENTQAIYLDSRYDVKSLEGLQYAKNLTSFSIYYNSNNINISLEPLYNLTNLKNFSISAYSSERFDISILSNFKQLENLSIYGYIKNETVLWNYTQLRVLRLNVNSDMDFNGLQQLENLENLEIYYNTNSNRIFDLNLIANMTNLQSFSINCQIANHQVLNNLQRITSLSLTNAYIVDLDFLANLTNLESLNLERNKITNILGLSNLTKLNYLNLRNNPININSNENKEIYEELIKNGTYIDIDKYDESQIIIIPDGELKRCLISNNIDTNNDDEFSINEMEKIENLDIYSNYAIKSLEGLQYATNLKQLSLSFSYDNTNISLEPIYNLCNLEKLSLFNGILEENNFDFLKGLTSLKELEIYNLNKEIDLTTLGDYTNLTSLSIAANKKLKNAQALIELSNLKKLKISQYGNGDFDISILNKLKQLEDLDISGNIKNQALLWNMIQLKRLRISTNSIINDFGGIQNFQNLEYLNFSGDICNITNFEQISKLENLNELIINYSSYSYNEDSSERTKRETEIINILENLKCEKIILDYSGTINLKPIQCGTTKTINLEDISPIYKAYLNKDSKLYCQSCTISNSTMQNNSNITVNDENKTITITAANEIKKEYGSIYMTLKHSDNNTYGKTINLNWQSYELGDSEKEINIPDKNLKQVLLRKYDINSDGKITEIDMINIIELEISEEEIRSIEGLQNAINLKYIYAGYDEITDITPIINLEKLEYINFYGNYISDITCLKNAKFLNNIDYEDALQFEYNFIDFTENNENYKILKNILYKNVSEGKDSITFVHTINNQKHGKFDEINNIVNLDANLKKKLIEIGVDTNNDGNITRKELYNINNILGEIIDLSNSNITDISGLEYLNAYSINLSNNNISNISGIEKCKQLSNIDLSYNNIFDITPISKLFYMTEDVENYDYGYGYTEIDLSHNKISNINCISQWKNIGKLNLSFNRISDISALKDYVFSENAYSEQKEIDLSNNFINLENQNNLKAIEHFKENQNPLILDTQKPSSEIAGFEVSKKYNSDTNTVTVTITSKSELQNTKPTWNLSDDKLQYSKEYSSNGTYTTTVVDVNGYSETLSFDITEIESGFEITKEYNSETNTVIVKVTSKNAFKETKPTWTLSEDKLTYSKIYEENGTYSTTFTDINGNIENLIYNIDEIDQCEPQIKIETKYDEKTNTVTVKAISNEKLGQTKPTWNLSDDKLTYSKIYEENGTYTTSFSDVYGNTTTVSFNVIEIQSGYEVFKSYNKEKNSVRVDVKSKCKLQETKPSWVLSEDGYTYSKEYYSNGTYTTEFTDINNKTEKVTFIIISIDDKAPEIEIEKVYNEETNTVTVKAKSNEILGQTKPTWTLSEDKLVYSKEYNVNLDVNTSFSDVYGNTTKVSFQVEEIQSEYEVQQFYDSKLNVVIVNVKSKCKLQETKPSWILSEDGYTYRKEYKNNGIYKTYFSDINGNTEEVTFEITLIDEEGPEIEILKEYDKETNTVIVKAVSNEILGQTKPTWNLSEDKLTYSKSFTLNGTYSTIFRDQYGNMTNIVFEVEEVQSGFEISKIYDNETNRVTVIVKSVCELKDTKPTWTLSEDRHSYSKVYEENGSYTTAFVDLNGKVENIKFDITEIDNEGPEIKIVKEYNKETNTVVVKAVSNEILGNTKPTWTLDEDKLIYCKKYNVNGIYTTVFSDQYGNTSKVTFEVSEIK